MRQKRKICAIWWCFKLQGEHVYEWKVRPKKNVQNLEKLRQNVFFLLYDKKFHRSLAWIVILLSHIPIFFSQKDLNFQIIEGPVWLVFIWQAAAHIVSLAIHAYMEEKTCFECKWIIWNFLWFPKKGTKKHEVLIPWQEPRFY